MKNDVALVGGHENLVHRELVLVRLLEPRNVHIDDNAVCSVGALHIPKHNRCDAGNEAAHDNLTRSGSVGFEHRRIVDVYPRQRRLRIEEQRVAHHDMQGLAYAAGNDGNRRGLHANGLVGRSLLCIAG